MKSQAAMDLRCRHPVLPPISARFQFEGGIAVEANAAIPVARGMEARFAETVPDNGCAAPLALPARRTGT